MTASKFTPAQRRWLDQQRAKWVPLSEQQALVLRGILRPPESGAEALPTPSKENAA